MATEPEQQKAPLKAEIFDKLSALVAAAFGLVAALAWNGAIQKAFELYVTPRFGGSSELWLLVSYATTVTIVAVLATIWIGRVAGKAKELKFPTGWARTLRHRGEQTELPPPGAG